MSSPTSLFGRLSLDATDEFAAVLGLVASLALVPLRLLTSQVYVETIPLFAAGACLVYLGAVRAGRSELRPVWSLGTDGLVPAQVVAAGTALLAVLATLSGGRTVPVLLLAGALGSVVLAQVAFLSERTFSPGLLLGQVLGLSLVVRFAGLLSTPGLIGVDSWQHVHEYAAAVHATGSLDAMGGVKYVAAPLYHLGVVAGAQLLDVSLRTSLFLVVGTATVVGALFVYAAARYFLEPRWAVFAAALFAFSDQAIRWGLHLIPTSLGLVLFLGVVFLLVRHLHAETGVTDLVLATALAVAVTLTHQLSAFVTLTVLGVAVLAQLLVRWRFAGPVARLHGDSRPAVVDAPVDVSGVFTAHLVVTLLVWSVTPFHDSTFLARMPDLAVYAIHHTAGFLDLVGGPSGGGAPATVPGPAGGSASVLAPYVDAAGFLLLLFVAILGSLALLGRHHSPQATATLVGAVAVLLVFAFVLPLFGIRTFLPGRWFAFAYALMALVGAVGVAHVVTRLPRGPLLAGLLVFLVVFPGAMATARKATLDDPTFEDQWPQYAYSASEIEAARTLEASVPGEAGPIATDHPYRTLFAGAGGPGAETINLTRLDRGPPYELSAYREYQSTGAPQFVVGRSTIATTQLRREQVCPPTANVVYASKETILCTQ